MLGTIASDLVDAVAYVFQSAEMIELLLMVVSAIAGAFMMGRAAAVFGVAFASLLVYALARYVYIAATAESVPGAESPWVAAAENAWTGFMSMSAAAITGYYLAFAIILLVLYLLKSLVMR